MKSTVWDKIYKDYQKGGPAWATLSRGLETDFKKFVEQTNFPIKKAFDIGYGTGHYLQYLKIKGFTVAGIDSSETAYKMARKAVGENNLVLGDMYEYEIPHRAYDLIYSISAIHHGTKAQVRKALGQVFDGLVEDGSVYITLPIIVSPSEWKSFKNRDEIEPGTFVLPDGPEKGLPHSFYSKAEVEELFSKYKGLKIKADEPGRWHITGQK